MCVFVREWVSVRVLDCQRYANKILISTESSKPNWLMENHEIIVDKTNIRQLKPKKKNKETLSKWFKLAFINIIKEMTVRDLFHSKWSFNCTITIRCNCWFRWNWSVSDKLTSKSNDRCWRNIDRLNQGQILGNIIFGWFSFQWNSNPIDGQTVDVRDSDELYFDGKEWKVKLN